MGVKDRILCQNYVSKMIKCIQRSHLQRHLDSTLDQMLCQVIIDETDFDECTVKLQEIVNEQYPLFARRWGHSQLK